MLIIKGWFLILIKMGSLKMVFNKLIFFINIIIINIYNIF